VFALVFGSALLAMLVQGALPEHHLSTDSKDVVKPGIALIATMAALVLSGALVAFGSVITIEPGAGALAFCAVVILTMFAAETFDPWLMWDAAAKRATAAADANPRLAAGD
jgi:uncharacterized paraquat-inducible protein A